jgi:hypothetical protein
MEQYRGRGERIIVHRSVIQVHEIFHSVVFGAAVGLGAYRGRDSIGLEIKYPGDPILVSTATAL